MSLPFEMFNKIVKTSFVKVYMLSVTLTEDFGYIDEPYEQCWIVNQILLLQKRFDYLPKGKQRNFQRKGAHVHQARLVLLLDSVNATLTE